MENRNNMPSYTYEYFISRLSFDSLYTCKEKLELVFAHQIHFFTQAFWIESSHKHQIHLHNILV